MFIDYDFNLYINFYTAIHSSKFVSFILKKSFNFKSCFNILNIAFRHVTQFKLVIFNFIVFNGKNIKEFKDSLIDRLFNYATDFNYADFL